MSSPVETSVITSLTELMRGEEARIEADRDIEQRRVEEERAAREAEQRAMRERETRRIAEEEERRRAEERREREQQARLDAIRAAELERGRREAELRATTDLERALSERGPLVETLRRQLRGAVIALCAVTSAWMLSLSIAIVWQDHRSDVRAAELARRNGEAEGQWTAERRALEDRLHGAEAQLGTARVMLSNLEKSHGDANARKPEVAGPTKPAGGGRPPPARKPCGGEGDPLCGLNGENAVP